LIAGKVYDEGYRYPLTVLAPQPRWDSQLPRHEHYPADSPRKYAPQRIDPRLVYQKDAAAYCSMGVPSFKANCPVAPVRVGPGMRGLRYDLYDLDGWIDSLKQISMSTEPTKNWLDRVGNDEGAN
jgi:hypothetical protein